MTSIANLVQETSTSTGTGNFTLSTPSGRQSFNTAFGTGGTDVFYYFITHRTAAEWEVGTGHMLDATTLVRDTVINSTNSNTAVNFSAGTKDITNAVEKSDIAQLVNLASTANGKGASLIGIEDAGTLITATTVEGALAELATTAGSLREVVSTNRTYYVRTDGSNSNDGLSNTAGGAFLTIQKAADVVARLDILGGVTITVQVATGTYAEVVSIRNQAGAGNVLFLGDTVTPANVNVQRFDVYARVNPVFIRGFRLTATSGVRMVESGAAATVDSLTFATGVAFNGIYNSNINANYGTFTFESAVTNIYLTNTGGVFTAFSATMNVSSCVWSAASAVYLAQFAFVWLQGVTFTGSATGKRYSVGAYCYLNTSGGGASFIPGSTAGSVDTAKFGTYT